METKDNTRINLNMSTSTPISQLPSRTTDDTANIHKDEDETIKEVLRQISASQGDTTDKHVTPVVVPQALHVPPQYGHDQQQHQHREQPIATIPEPWWIASLKHFFLLSAVILACFFIPNQKFFTSYVPSMHSLTPVARQVISAIAAAGLITFVLPISFPRV